jgi:hypothetical protein
MDCGTGQKCAAGLCVVLKSTGEMCGNAEECASGFCAGGFCCNSACSGGCESCGLPNKTGRCSPLAQSTGSACGVYACDGVSGACPTSCMNSLQCAAGRYCSAAGVCELPKTLGQACGNAGECASRFCADGVCCNTACAGSCDVCSGATPGTCHPSPAGSPGSPACPATSACNGTLADCPILCSSGCPTNTFCSGTYCAAKRPNGTSCAAAGECTSNFCADGVCCNTACGGSCDACASAAGSSADGVCTLVSAAKVCRASVNACDAEERCTGTSADCPANGFQASGVSCGQTAFTPYGTCASSGCATNGMQSRTKTDKKCDGSGTCGSVDAVESQMCTRVTENTSCGAVVAGAWSACAYSDATCSTTGSRTRSISTPLCMAGACAMVQSTETDTAGCARPTNNTSCGASAYSAYSGCGYAQTCSTSGSRTRVRTDRVCASGACASVDVTETDTAGCMQSTNGLSCGAPVTTAWSACDFSGSAACATTGIRTRQTTSYSCGSGSCVPLMTVETDTTSCNRVTEGTTCQPSVFGAYSACSYGAQYSCSNSGTRSRSRTDFTCVSGGCTAGAAVTEAAICTRNSNGITCGVPACTACRPCRGSCDDKVCDTPVCLNESCTDVTTTVSPCPGSCARLPICPPE